MDDISIINDAKKFNKITQIEIEPSAFKNFLKLIKIGIVNSNLITTFTGIWLSLHFSGGSFLEHFDIVLLIMIGTAFIIAGSCTLNNYIDQDIDHLMDRTKSRPTVTGKADPYNVLILGLLFVTIGLVTLAFASITAALLGLIGVVTYVVIYSIWTKRRYTTNTIIGSISGAMPPLIGWAGVDPNLNIIAWILFMIVFIWQPPHFLALAMKRCEEYRNAGIPMLPVVYGFNMTKRQINIWIACLIPIPFLLPSLGLTFLVFATFLNICWLYLGMRGYKMKDEIKWANRMFIYSINYLTILCIAMIVVTLY